MRDNDKVGNVIKVTYDNGSKTRGVIIDFRFRESIIFDFEDPVILTEDGKIRDIQLNNCDYETVGYINIKKAIREAVARKLKSKKRRLKEKK